MMFRRSAHGYWRRALRGCLDQIAADPDILDDDLQEQLFVKGLDADQLRLLDELVVATGFRPAKLISLGLVAIAGQVQEEAAGQAEPLEGERVGWD